MESNGIDIERSLMVSICCLVYNHEPFLRECFDGFVMQQTTFPIEILVHDDASTDNSAEIIREYTAKYPDLFKPIYQTENQYSKGKGYVGMTLNIERAKGKYIAFCEGDDYWTDMFKLQKQVEFLEEHEDFVVAFHNAKIISDDGNDIADLAYNRLPDEMCRDWSSVELMCGWTPPTPTVMYKTIYYTESMKELQRAKSIINGDTVLASIIGKYGKGKFMSNIKNSVCRTHIGGVWQLKTDVYKAVNLYRTFTFLQKIHKNKIVKRNIRIHRLCMCSRIILLPDTSKRIYLIVCYYVRMLFLAFVCRDVKTVHNTNKGIICRLLKK